MPKHEQPAVATKQTRAENSGGTPEPVQLPELPPDAAAALQRVEKLLGDIRGALDATARERAHHEYSPRRLIGAILQVIVVGLTLLALLDWLLDAAVEGLLVKLAFAAVLQLAALTAFLISREKQ